MLAQNFKTAADLKVTEAEFDALKHVLAMLERQELHPEKHRDRNGQYSPTKPGGFNMNCTYEQNECGTIGCIGGWCAVTMGLSDRIEINRYVKVLHSHSLYDLYWSRCNETITPSQAAIAVRNFLTDGEPRWSEALA